MDKNLFSLQEIGQCDANHASIQCQGYVCAALLPFHPVFCALCMIINKLLMPDKKAYYFDNMRALEISHTSWKSWI